MKKHHRATYSSDIRNVALARRSIAGFAAACGFSGDDVSDIRLAVGEALSNAVEHGSGTVARNIIVECTFEDATLVVMIEDSGSTFSEPSVRTSVEPDHRGRGFGIFLMRRLMDEVTFARNGTIVRLVRHRSLR
ncbi:MAG TPA: ATP-binding protein [Candidatus Cybelea sp.]